LHKEEEMPALARRGFVAGRYDERSERSEAAFRIAKAQMLSLTESPCKHDVRSSRPVLMFLRQLTVAVVGFKVFTVGVAVRVDSHPVACPQPDLGLP
jgi:hypothetical protein